MAPSNKGPKLELNKYGAWEIRWSENRRSMRRSTGETDRSAAELKLAKFLQTRNRLVPAVSALRIGPMLEDYLREHVDEGEVIDKSRQHDIANNLRPFFGDLVAQDLMPAEVRAYMAGRRDGTIGSRKCKSNGTIRRELNMLVAVYNHAVRARRFPAAELPYIPLPKQPAPKDMWLNEEEVGQLLAAAALEDERYPGGDRGALFVRIALATAARRRSIETLTWAQIDFTARRIRFNPEGRLQSAKRRVAVPISDDLLPHLQRAYACRQSDFVLTTTRSVDKRLDACCMRAFKATGNDRFLKVTPHVLRHTWATLAARAGVSMFEIAGVLGDTLATVQKNYLHHSPEHLRAAVNFMSEKPTVAPPQHPAASGHGALNSAQPQDLRATSPDTSRQQEQKSEAIPV